MAIFRNYVIKHHLWTILTTMWTIIATLLLGASIAAFIWLRNKKPLKYQRKGQIKLLIILLNLGYKKAMKLDLLDNFLVLNGKIRSQLSEALAD